MPVERCHTSQLTAAYTGLNAAMGGIRGMTLILTNHSGGTCYVYGYPGLAFFNGTGFPMATHLTWMKAPHARVVLHPRGNAQAMLTWRVNVGRATPFSPSVARVTPPDEYTYLSTLWQGGPVLGGGIVAWPLRGPGGATQAWAIGQVSGNDFGSITNLAAGNVLTDPAKSTANGTRLVMQTSRGDLSYPWHVSYHHYAAR